MAVVMGLDQQHAKRDSQAGTWSKTRWARTRRMSCARSARAGASIYEWLARYHAGGWDALKAKPLADRPTRIAAQIRYLYRAIAGQLRCDIASISPCEGCAWSGGSSTRTWV
jgi:hypothetical protein